MYFYKPRVNQQSPEYYLIGINYTPIPNNLFETLLDFLKDYKKIIFTGNTHQELGLSRIETPQTLLDKVNKNFSIPVFRLNSDGYDFPVYRLEGKFERNGKKYTIDLRPEKGMNFALIGTIKIPIN